VHKYILYILHKQNNITI